MGQGSLVLYSLLDVERSLYILLHPFKTVLVKLSDRQPWLHIGVKRSKTKQGNKCGPNFKPLLQKPRIHDQLRSEEEFLNFFVQNSSISYLHGKQWTYFV